MLFIRCVVTVTKAAIYKVHSKETHTGFIKELPDVIMYEYEGHTHTCTVKLSWTIKSLRTHRDGATHMLSSVRSHLHPQPLQKHILVSGSLFNATSRSLAEIRRHTGGLAELPRSGPHHTHTHTRQITKCTATPSSRWSPKVWRWASLFCVLLD